jgi:colanic acid/amylovoran biosynthesis glycosyltransferase
MLAPTVTSAADASRPVVAHVTRASIQPTETFIHNQLVGLRRYRPIVVCHHRGHGRFPIVPDLVAHETRTGPSRSLDTISDRVLRTPLPGTIDAMARFIKQRDARILHFHYLVNARSYLPLERRTGVPTVVSAYGYDVTLFPQRAGGLGRRYLAPIFSRPDCFLAMSEAMRRDLVELGCPEDRIRVHYHGADTRRFAFAERPYAPRTPMTIMSCGRLVPTKGHVQLIEALAVVRRRSPVPFRAVIIGEGPLRHRLERTIDRLGMADMVQLAGYVPYSDAELVACYRDADVFALPCSSDNGQREGIPGAVVEAMAAGLPIVSTHHGGIPEVVRDGREGLLVRDGDVGELADAVERLLGDEPLRRALGNAAATRAARELDIAPASGKLERLYDELRGRSP